MFSATGCLFPVCSKYFIFSTSTGNYNVLLWFSLSFISPAYKCISFSCWLCKYNINTVRSVKQRIFFCIFSAIKAICYFISRINYNRLINTLCIWIYICIIRIKNAYPSIITSAKLSFSV